MRKWTRRLAILPVIALASLGVFSVGTVPAGASTPAANPQCQKAPAAKQVDSRIIVCRDGSTIILRNWSHPGVRFEAINLADPNSNAIVQKVQVKVKGFKGPVTVVVKSQYPGVPKQVLRNVKNGDWLDIRLASSGVGLSSIFLIASDSHKHWGITHVSLPYDEFWTP